jgi:heat shock protein HslJ
MARPVLSLVGLPVLNGAKVFRSLACVVFLLAAATFSVACDESLAAPSSTSQSAATASVTDGIWKLQSFQRADTTVVPVPDPSRFTIEVTPDGRLAVRADCNRCSGSYSQSSGALRIGAAMACTRAFCSTSPFDTQFAAALSDATLVRATDTTLEFVSAAGVLKFAR